MCVVSMVMDQYRPHIPDPYVWPQTPVNPVPSAPNTVVYRPDNERVEALAKEIAELKELIESFRKAVEAAETFDKLTGQPDCIDPEKAKLLETVTKLEQKIKKLEHPSLVTIHVEYEFDIDLDECENSETPESVLKHFQDFDEDWTDTFWDLTTDVDIRISLVED